MNDTMQWSRILMEAYNNLTYSILRGRIKDAASAIFFI